MRPHRRLAMVVPIAGLIAVLAAAPTASAKPNPKPTTTTTTTTVPITTEPPTTEPPTTVPTTTTTETPTSPTTTATPTATADVTYSPLYAELLAKYASVEATWAPIRGVYGIDPECALRQEQGEPIACGQVVVIMNPDGTFGTGWVEDPAAPDGWRQILSTDCTTDSDLWLCWM